MLVKGAPGNILDPDDYSIQSCYECHEWKAYMCYEIEKDDIWYD